ncbi:hypothetical protein VNO77_28981 [Canavalia gladiata]|uniref:Uncharacterized protein n=1 Tax=Canavalia gladiata TaxID=3824 RepID=A0AAN9KZU6_CANGL
MAGRTSSSTRIRVLLSCSFQDSLAPFWRANPMIMLWSNDLQCVSHDSESAATLFLLLRNTSGRYCGKSSIGSCDLDCGLLRLLNSETLVNFKFRTASSVHMCVAFWKGS